MSHLLDEQYLTWLYGQVGSVKVRTPSKTYWSLLKQLYTKEFIWFVPNDDNRVEDGRDLRIEFYHDTGVSLDAEWMGLGCSFLELMVGLSRRLAFEGEGEPRDWFWVMIDNLGLTDYNDSYFHQHDSYEDIEEVLDGVIWRTYDADGSGGFFPLTHPDRDQRNVEIWYQLCAYILELD